MCKSMNPNLCFKSMQIRMDIWICNVTLSMNYLRCHVNGKVGELNLSIGLLFNISEIADIMGDLTNGMRDLTGAINWRTHRWR